MPAQQVFCLNGNAAMTTKDSEREPDRSIPCMAQPIEMKTPACVYGVDILDGDDAWTLFEASTAGTLSLCNS